MYRATLKEGKTYHVGGVTFIKGTPRVVSDELGEYLVTLPVFDVEAVPYHEEPLETLHATDLAVLTHIAEAEQDRVILARPATEQDEVPPAGSAAEASEKPEGRKRGTKRGKQDA